MAFLLRNVRTSDYRDLRRLGKELDTVNLPSTPGKLRGMIKRSLDSFSGRYKNHPEKAQFLFVLEDLKKQKVVGTSKVYARHGTSQRPHLYFQILEEKVRSQTLRVNFLRKFYRLKTDKRGYTEIGGLVLDPEYRGHPEKLGKQMSLFRFLFLKAHPSWFRRRVIAELLPPFRTGGQSSLYQFYGYRLTRLPYQKADLLSFRNKEFILKFFPKSDLYHDILPPEVQADMGKTGVGSEAARRILTKIGFSFANQVDPLDGGPNYVAKLFDIEIYRQARLLRYQGFRSGKFNRSFLCLWEREGEVFGVLHRGKVLGRRLYFQESKDTELNLIVGQKLWVYPWK